MKRRVIQIADSTQLISLPRKWAMAHGIKKGDELNIEEDGDKVIVSTEKDLSVKDVEFDAIGIEFMAPRFVHALYKKGVDNIKINFDAVKDMDFIQKSLGKEAVGFEITNQTNSYYEVKHISGELEDMEPILKRTFLLLISMSEQALESISSNKFDNLPNISFLEESNNRFTTTIRRFLNKTGKTKYRPIGPLYYIIEDMENLADEYKYLCNHIFNIYKKGNIGKQGINKELLKKFNEVNFMLREFYELFYKFDKTKILDLGKKRKQLVTELLPFLEDSTKSAERVIAHYLLVISQKIFCFIGPYLVITL